MGLDNNRSLLKVADREYQIYDLSKVASSKVLARLPYAQKILLENLVRHQDNINITQAHIDAVVNWDAKAKPATEISFTPSRVILQDFTGVPAVVDLAAMRDAMENLGGDVSKINPLSPAELVIDHSVMVDHYGTSDAMDLNAKLEFQRNAERYGFLRWGQEAFDNFKVVPPDTGIIHQINLEFLARVVFDKNNQGENIAYPDTVVGTDSHTTMINGIGVLGWGVGGIEAEAAMLGQPITMLIPQVVGFKLTGKLAAGATATDLVLKVVKMLRDLGVVGKFVEFYGDGLSQLSLADRATIANMAPEYGATCGIFPIDEETLNYLDLSGRDPDKIELVREYAKAQTLFRDESIEADYSDVLVLDLSTIVPALSGPKRPQDYIELDKVSKCVEALLDEQNAHLSANIQLNGKEVSINDGDVMVAAITSCTNTSNPSVMMGAGLLAKKAVEKGLQVKPWVKTSLAPGSLVVTDYLKKAGLLMPMEQLGFDIVGYGCTTCIGNTGPLLAPIAKAIIDNDMTMCSVLSGNRNFEGRIHSLIKMNFLASPPLVIAYALAGTTKIDWDNDSLGQDASGNDIFLADIWPDPAEIYEVINQTISREMFMKNYESIYSGDVRWQSIEVASSQTFNWDNQSTYIQNPPYFEGMTKVAPGIPEISGARILLKLGDMITTDHISPAGSIAVDSPAAQYLRENNVAEKDFNSYGSRRGNHEVMMRGTFANIRLRNQLASGTEGGWTTHYPSKEVISVYDAAMHYKSDGVSLVIFGGKEYGAGSSRDWAAKGTNLLGVKAVITESYERIHRSNLVGMGVLPLQFKLGESHESHGITGDEVISIQRLFRSAKEVTMVVEKEGETKEIVVDVRIDTPKEWDYYENGGILHYVLRDLT
ncbi:MAG: aconitate hydratase AcnA [Ostreibacterium sp.]